MLPQKRQWCRRSSNEKLARQRVQAVAELSGTQAGLLELAFIRATILASTRSGQQRPTAAPQTLVLVREVPSQRKSATPSLIIQMWFYDTNQYSAYNMRKRLVSFAHRRRSSAERVDAGRAQSA